MDGGQITAALIFGAIISIITLVVGRGIKISELRQAWINDQRSDLGKWSAAALSLSRDDPGSSRAADFLMLDEAAYRIRLRENPRKKEWDEVIAKMNRVRDALIANNASENVLHPQLIDIAGDAQIRLKKDWQRVKYGEPGYWGLLALLALLVAAFALKGIDLISGPESKNPRDPVEQRVSGSIQLLPPPPEPIAKVRAEPEKKTPVKISPQTGVAR